MRRIGISFFRRFLRGERGQAAVVVALTATGMMALSGAAIETGHVYYAYQRLVASTNSAAMAGAQMMPNTTEASTYVTNYSSETGEYNATPLLTNVVATPTFLCLSTVSGSLNVPCSTSTGGTGGYNALSVKQTATIPLWFGGLIGMRQMNMAATATAAMRGGQNSPWNIAIILDATPSMAFQDNGAQCSGTQLYCAQQGIQALLKDLYPCQLSQTCTGSGATVVDNVSLFVFPAVTAATAYKDYTCNAGSPTAVAYTFPDPPSSTVLPSGDTYQTVTWSSDYKTSDTATSLNTSSHLVIAAGGDMVKTYYSTSCPGVQTRYEWTYYAQVIYAAQTALAAQQAANPNSKNAIILLGDGDTEACAANAYTAGGACNNSPLSLVAGEGTLNGTGTATTNPTGYNSVTYPSALGQCGQSVLAAQAAAKAGTAFYTIGYGAENTSAPRSQTNITGNCPSDIYYSASVTTNGGTWGVGGTPCQSLAAMASAAVNFYSDDANGCQATAPSNQSITKLTAIFRAITNNLSTPRLIPNGSS
jgi:Flp pilus assembly protein TadG